MSFLWASTIALIACCCWFNPNNFRVKQTEINKQTNKQTNKRRPNKQNEQQISKNSNVSKINNMFRVTPPLLYIPPPLSLTRTIFIYSWIVDGTLLRRESEIFSILSSSCLLLIKFHNIYLMCAQVGLINGLGRSG